LPYDVDETRSACYPLSIVCWHHWSRRDYVGCWPDVSGTADDRLARGTGWAEQVFTTLWNRAVLHNRHGPAGCSPWRSFITSVSNVDQLFADHTGCAARRVWVAAPLGSGYHAANFANYSAQPTGAPSGAVVVPLFLHLSAAVALFGVAVNSISRRRRRTEAIERTGGAFSTSAESRGGSQVRETAGSKGKHITGNTPQRRQLGLFQVSSQATEAS